MKSYCNLPFERFRIDFNGEYQSCCHQTDYYGNIFDEGKSLKDIWSRQSKLREVKVATLNQSLHKMCNNNTCPLYTTNLEKNKEVTLNEYPTQIEFALSPLMCNIGGENPTPKTACAMCPRSNADWMKPYIDGTIPDRTDQLLEFIKPAVATNLETLTVLGIIEPFYRGQIFDVLDKLEFKKYNEHTLFWTFCNATLFGEKNQKKFLEYVNKSCFGFSVDAATPETYKKVRKLNYFDTVTRNITNWFDRCKEEGRWDESFIANNINMWNVHEVPDMVRYAKQVGARLIEFTPTHGEKTGTQLPYDAYCTEHNWEIFDEAQEKATEVGKQIGMPVRFYVPLHRGFKK